MLTQIRSFLAVAEEGSLHRAASRLRMSQPALSRQMQALENEVGGRLLERTSTGVQLTAGGHALLKKMGAVLKAYDHALLEVRRLVRGESGLLRVGYLGSAAREYLNEPLARVREEHPKVKFKVLDLSPGEQIAALRAGQIDVGLTDESGELLSRDFYTRAVATMASYVALPVQHPLAQHKQIRVAELKDEVFVTGAEEHVPGVTRRIVSYCRRYGKFRPKLAGGVESLADAFEMIANENAVAIVPAFVRHHVVPGVTILPLAERDLTWQILLVWQRGKTGGALRALINALLSGNV
jgi:DNA-binding transcriptional LysR family regulator